MPGIDRPDDAGPDRLARYEARTDRPLLLLSLAFIVVYALEVAAPQLPSAVRTALTAASWLIWGIFAVDLVVHVWLVERRGRYVLTHPIDVLIVALPALRPLRVLRVFTAGQALVTRGGRISLLRSTQAIATVAGVLVLIAALAVLDAERNAPGTHIANLADALWWAATTVTTVGYGDTFPITGTGRVVAVALMLVGISLVGVVTATIAAWFLDQTRQTASDEESDLAARLDRVEATLAEIHAVVLARGHDSPGTGLSDREGAAPRRPAPRPGASLGTRNRLR